MGVNGGGGTKAFRLLHIAERLMVNFEGSPEDKENVGDWQPDDGNPKNAVGMSG